VSRNWGWLGWGWGTKVKTVADSGGKGEGKIGLEGGEERKGEEGGKKLPYTTSKKKTSNWLFPETVGESPNHFEMRRAIITEKRFKYSFVLNKASSGLTGRKGGHRENTPKGEEK